MEYFERRSRRVLFKYPGIPSKRITLDYPLFSEKQIQALFKSSPHLQTNKNSELAGVLIKFEERVKQRDKRLEEAAAADGALRRELEQKNTMIKQLEKTVVERENRLYQVTSQLEEMKRVQEMVVKLMSKSASNAI